MKETEYWQCTDTFEQKLDLLKGAFERRDFILARALTESLKNTLVFAQQEEESLGAPLLRADAFARVAELPTSWQEWARGWLYYKALALDVENDYFRASLSRQMGATRAADSQA